MSKGLSFREVIANIQNGQEYICTSPQYVIQRILCDYGFIHFGFTENYNENYVVSGNEARYILKEWN